MKKIVYIENDTAKLVVPVIDDIEKVKEKAVPTGCDYLVVEDADFPSHPIFFEAWEISNTSLTVNFSKAKNRAHNIRREIRGKKFAPLDEIVAKQIPGKSTQAENSRQNVRDEDAVIQVNIDNAQDLDTLANILQGYENNS